MTGKTVLKVAVNAPLSRLFDYLPGDGPAPMPGCRVRVAGQIERGRSNFTINAHGILR